MKNFILLSFSIIGLALLTSCGGGGGGGGTDPLVEQLKSLALANGWRATNVRAGTLDVSQDYTSFVLTISGTDPASFNYATGGATAGITIPWPKSGSMKLNSTTNLTRLNDNLSIDYTLSSNQLVMTFTSGDTGFSSRADGLAGVWIFTFQPK